MSSLSDLDAIRDSDLRREPIVWGPEYNVTFFYLEKLHPFDSCKGAHVVEELHRLQFTRRPLPASGNGSNDDDAKSKKKREPRNRAFYDPPSMATDEDLLRVHSQEYLDSLKSSLVCARISEVAPVAFLPNFIVRRRLVTPMKYQTGGTVNAARHAMETGWGINLGGGFHHCSRDQGAGFCMFGDIQLAIDTVKRERFADRELNVLIVDCDAHQGNGYATDYLEKSALPFNLVIVDLYNKDIYPNDTEAKRAIDVRVELSSGCQDAEYLSKLRGALQKALKRFKPDFVVFNAGTDILAGDPLGHLEISAEGVIERDETVFRFAREEVQCPILMVLSGGYQMSNARVIAESMVNLREKNLIPRCFVV